MWDAVVEELLDGCVVVDRDVVSEAAAIVVDVHNSHEIPFR